MMPHSAYPPVPLDFTYTPSLEPLIGVGGDVVADGGCEPTCACCGHDRNDDDCSSVLEHRKGSSAGEGSGRAVGVPGGPLDRSCACGVAVPGGRHAYDPGVGGLAADLRSVCICLTRCPCGMACSALLCNDLLWSALLYYVLYVVCLQGAACQGRCPVVHCILIDVERALITKGFWFCHLAQQSPTLADLFDT